MGTYLEHKFQDFLASSFTYARGSSATGIDFPGLNVDMKVTNIRQPQSSSPFKSAQQKVLGLGHSLLIFVYEKTDNDIDLTATINIAHAVYIDELRTADYQTTRGVLEIINRDGNTEDIIAFMRDRNLPIDESELVLLANKLLYDPPHQGYLTISNALQWRLQYGRVVDVAGNVAGIERIV